MQEDPFPDYPDDEDFEEFTGNKGATTAFYRLSVGRKSPPILGRVTTKWYTG